MNSVSLSSDVFHCIERVVDCKMMKITLGKSPSSCYCQVDHPRASY